MCDFLTYCRYVTQGLVKVHCNQENRQKLFTKRKLLKRLEESIASRGIYYIYIPYIIVYQD